MTTEVGKRRRVDIYLPSLPSGGVERLYLNLVPYFVRAGFAVTFVLDQGEGTLFGNIPPGVETIILGAKRLHITLPRLAAYLQESKPDILLTAQHHKTISAIWAKRFAHSPCTIVATAHMPIKPIHRIDSSVGNFLIPALMRLFLPQADRVVAVSKGLAGEIAARYYRKPVDVIYNGVTPENFEAMLASECSHPWLCSDLGVPVFVSCGRLDRQKGFDVLLKSFSVFLTEKKGKLVIFGEGPQRTELTALATALGIAPHVDFVGFTHNVFPAMRAATVFVSASRFEAFSLVLAEALACGTPVISTDCDFGPREVLDHGRYGTLVPVEDVTALANAMRDFDVAGINRAEIKARGQSFSISTCAEHYLSLFKTIFH